MIQYVKFHKDQYISKLVGTDKSVSVNDENKIKEIFDELQDKFFPANSNNSLIYYVNNNYYFLLKIRINKITTAHGIYGVLNNFNECPILFSNLLSIENIVDENSLNLNLQVPSVPSTPTICDKKYIFPKLIDAIITNEKNIIIYVENEKEFLSYAYILYELLPLKLRNKLSVVYNSQRLVDERSNENKIRVFFTSNSSVLDGNYDSSNFIFNTTADSDRPITNYEGTNKILIDFYQSFESYLRSNRLNELKRLILSYEFFDKDGNIDLLSIEKAIILTKFENNKNIVNAKEVLEFAIKNYGKMNEDQKISIAVKFILSDKFQIENLKVLKELFNAEQKFKVSFKNDYLNYLVDAYMDNISGNNNTLFELLDEILSLVSSVEEEVLVNGVLNRIFENEKTPKRANQNYFKLIFGIYYETKYDNILIKIADYFHFNNTGPWNNFIFKELYQECILFEKAKGQDSYDELYIKRFTEDHKPIPVLIKKALFAMIASICTNLDELMDRNVINLRYAYLVDYLKHKCHGKDIVYNLFDFSNIYRKFISLFKGNNYNKINLNFGDGDNLLPRKEVKDLIELLSFEEKIDILMNTSFMSKLTNYPLLFELLNECCISIDVVKKNIKSFTSTAERFYNLLVNGAFVHDQNYNDVLNYIVGIKQNDNIRQDFLNYRLDFSKKQFDLLDDEEKTNITESYGNVNELLVNVSEGDTEGFKKRKKLLDDIYINYKNTFKVNIFKEEGMKKYKVAGVVVGLLEIAIAFVLILLVPIFKFFSLNLDFMFLVNEFVVPEMFLILLYIAVLFFSIYFVYYRDEAIKDKRKCLKPAILYSFLLGILPLICFVATYLLVYYFGNGIVH